MKAPLFACDNLNKIFNLLDINAGRFLDLQILPPYATSSLIFLWAKSLSFIIARKSDTLARHFYLDSAMAHFFTQRFLESFSLGMIGCAFIVFLLLCFQTSPYGRYAKKASAWWGLNIPARVAWVVQEMPSFLWPLYFIIMEPPASLAARVILLLFLAHYFQRIFIFSLRIRTSNTTRLVPFVLAFFFCFINGFLQSAYISAYFVFANDAISWVFLILGLVIFVFGMGINIHSDYLLRNLRRPGESGHKIPIGGFFRYVSGANFLGEIVEWFGFCMMCAFALPPLAFLAFTIANIGMRAYHHHRYYLEQFPDYPKNRKALIPFII